tara:strand:- start:5479 stop:5646 length:168 start_codon:yes stop_codon:yes gene_type:complete
LQRIPFGFEIFNFLTIFSIFALKHEVYQPLTSVMAKRDATKILRKHTKHCLHNGD